MYVRTLSALSSLFEIAACNVLWSFTLIALNNSKVFGKLAYKTFSRIIVIIIVIIIITLFRVI